MSDTFEFACEKCEQRFRVSTARIGSPLNCPRCETELVVPTKEVGALQIAARRIRRQEAKLSPQQADEFVIRDDSPQFSDRFRASAQDRSRDVDARFLAIPRTVVYLQAALLVAVAVISLGLGLVLGLQMRRPATQVVAGPHTIAGRIGFEDARGREQVDSGSLVFVLPADARLQSPLPADGIQPGGNGDLAGHASLAAVHVLGGGIVEVGDDGEYELEVPSSGPYYVLILSNHAARPAGREPLPQDLAEIGRYFVPAFDLLGRRGYQWLTFEIRENTVVNHVFRR